MIAPFTEDEFTRRYDAYVSLYAITHRTAAELRNICKTYTNSEPVTGSISLEAWDEQPLAPPHKTHRPWLWRFYGSHHYQRMQLIALLAKLEERDKEHAYIGAKAANTYLAEAQKPTSFEQFMTPAGPTVLISLNPKAITLAQNNPIQLAGMSIYGSLHKDVTIPSFKVTYLPMTPLKIVAPVVTMEDAATAIREFVERYVWRMLNTM